MEIEDRTVVRSRQVAIHPASQRVVIGQGGYALMLDGGKHGAADQDLAPCIALAVRHRGARDESVSFRAEAMQAIVEGLDAGASDGGLGQAPMLGGVSALRPTTTVWCIWLTHGEHGWRSNNV